RCGRRRDHRYRPEVGSYRIMPAERRQLGEEEGRMEFLTLTARGLDTFAQDLVYTIRQMRREPGVTVVIVAVLTLAIGANTAIFSAIDSTLIKPLPYPDPDRLVTVRETTLDNPGASAPVSSENFVDWKDRVPAFEAVAAWQFDYFNVSGHDEPEQVQGFRTSA